MTSKDMRWKQRFANFDRAYNLLDEGIASTSQPSKLEQEGIIQRFEYTFELAWKVMKDYLEYEGIKTNLPREILKQAFANEIIVDGKTWMDILEKRNLLSHTYDEKNFNEACNKVRNNYFDGIQQVWQYFKDKL